MQIIEIVVENGNYQIEWALSEHFEELKGMKFMLKLTHHTHLLVNHYLPSKKESIIYLKIEQK